jgi:hypothetical protein
VRLWDSDIDSDGERSTRLVSSEYRCVAFGVADATGELLVDPEGLELLLEVTEDTTEQLGQGRWRDEISLRAEQQVVLIGHVQERAGRVVVARGPEPDAVFAVSTAQAVRQSRQRSQLLREATPYAWVAAAVSVVLLLIPDAQLHQLGMPTHCEADRVILSSRFAWICTGVPLPVVFGPGVLFACAAIGLVAVLIRWAPIARPLALLALSVCSMIFTGLPVILLLLLFNVSEPRCWLVWGAILVAQTAFIAQGFEHWAQRWDRAQQ